MDRVVRLYQLWSWLPHFRAIAETEHLPTASEALGLSPSALSRALKQLEAAVGCELFDRDGRAIRINEAGEELLRAVRLAMRGIDDALTSLSGDTSPLPIRIAAPGPFHAALIIDAVADLSRQHPRVRAELSSVGGDDLVGALCRGLIDVCLHEGAIEHPDLESEVLAEIPKRIACGPDHPLAGAGELSIDDLAGHPFVAPPADARGLREDGWPVGVEREVGLTVTRMRLGIDACVTGNFLAILSRPLIAANGLIELDVADIELPTSPFHATTRRQLETQPAEFTELLAAIRERCS